MGRLRKRAAQRVFDRLKARALAAGATEEQFDLAVGELEDERPLLDWLMNGGFEKLLAMIMQLIELFGAT